MVPGDPSANYGGQGHPDFHPNTSLDISHSQSINTICSIPYCTAEDLQAGSRYEGKMSNVRRFFCLFVTFDFSFISLMWLICVVLKGENIVEALKEQIFHYTIYKSMFDVVLIAFFRFVILIVFYAIFYFNHWIFVSITTSLSCAALIGKVFMYDWKHSSQQVFEVLLILSSFVISWGEAWFLDFRVVPQEMYASRYFSTGDRAPILPGNVQTQSDEQLGREPTESCFFSVHEENGSQTHLLETACPYREVQFSKDQEDHYKKVAAKTLEKAWELVHKPDWKEAKRQGNDVVYSRKHPRGGKMFKIVAQIDAAADFIKDELCFKVHEMPKWNTAIKEAYKIQAFGEKTDICYQISYGVAGVVKSREFVTLRRWAYKDGCFIIASVGCSHPSTPETKTIVRGEPDVNCFLMKPLPRNPNKCELQWVFNTNLKMNIPRFIYEPDLIKSMFKFVQELRNRLLSLKSV